MSPHFHPYHQITPNARSAPNPPESPSIPWSHRSTATPHSSGIAHLQAELARTTGRLEYLGERTDLAAVHKLLGNAMIIGTWAVLADVLDHDRAEFLRGVDVDAQFRERCGEARPAASG